MKILVIDDYKMVSTAILNRVEKTFPKATPFYASNFRDATAIFHVNEIRLILCDLEFENEPDCDGFSFIRKIKKQHPEVKTVALTHYQSYAIMKQALDAGYNSFLSKGCSQKDFSQTLLGVINLDLNKSKVYRSETMNLLYKKRYDSAKTEFSSSLHGIGDLSDREAELVLFSPESTNRQVLAKKMQIKPNTVDSYFKNVFQKLDLHSRKEVALFAREFEKEILSFKKHI